MSATMTIGTMRCLKKPKINKHAGWIQPLRRQNIRRDKNDIKTARQLFKDKRAKPFIRENTLSCVPAIRMVNFDFTFMSRPDGMLDMGHLNPKMIGSLMLELAGCTEMMTDFGYIKIDQMRLPEKFENKSIKQQLALCNNAYGCCVPHAKRYYTSFKNENITRPGGDGKDLIKLLFAWVKSQGGAREMIKNAGYYRPDAMGAVIKENGFYATFPMNARGQTFRFCGFCHTPNVYSHRDGFNKPFRSSNPDLPLHEVYDDNYEYEQTTWEKQGDKWYNRIPVAWRCRWCGGDLSVVPIDNAPACYVDSIIKLTEYFIGGLLDQLRLINATDFFDEADPTHRQMILEHDLSIAKRMLVYLWHGELKIPTDIDHADFKILTTHLPQVKLIKSVCANSVCSPLITDAVLATGVARSLYAGSSVVIEGSIIPLTDAFTGTTNYCNWLLPGSDKLIEMEHIILSVGAYSRTLTDILTTVNNCHGCHAIVPSSMTAIKDNTCMTISCDGVEALVSINNKANVLQLNAMTVSALMGDVIQTKYGYHVIHRIHTGIFFDVVYITKESVLNILNFNWLTNHATVTATLPIPTYFNTSNGTLEVGVECITAELNLDLFRALCIRNISAKMEFNALTKYAIGFNMRRYTTGKVVLRQDNISYDIINFHVLACMYAMKLLNNRVTLTKLVYNTFSSADMRQLILSAVSTMAADMKLPIVEISNILLDHVDAGLVNGLITKTLRSLTSARATRNVRVMAKFDIDVNTGANNLLMCPHHSFMCNHTIILGGCVCCGVDTNGQEYCNCCKPVNLRQIVWSAGVNVGVSLLINKLTEKIKVLKPEPKKLELLPEGTAYIPPNDKPKKKYVRPKQQLKSIESKPLTLEKPNTNTLTLRDFMKNLLDNLGSQQVVSKALDNILDITHVENFYTEALDVLDVDLLSIALTNNLNSFIGNDCSIRLPFIFPGLGVIPQINVVVEGRISLPNSSIDNCGYIAYRHVTQTTMNFDEFCSLTGSNELFSIDQLFLVADFENKNLCVIVNINDMTRLEYYIIDPLDVVPTIILDMLPNADIGHYSPCNVTFTSRPIYYLCDPLVSFDQRRLQLQHMKMEHWLTTFNGDVEENLAIESLLLIHNEIASDVTHTDLLMTELAGKIYISNNKLDDPLRNKYNFELIYHPELAPFIVGESISDQHPLFLSNFNVPKSIPNDLTVLHRQMTIDETLKIVMCRRDLLNQIPNNLTYISQTRVEVGKFLQLTLTSGYLKPLDVIALKFKGQGVVLATVMSVSRNLILIDKIVTPDKFDLIMHKTSIASSLKRIRALQSAQTNGLMINLLLNKAVCISGYGGSGKSEYIIGKQDFNNLAITITTIAKDNLISRGYHNRNCMTLERALSSDLNNFKSIFIDEANMMDYLDLSLFIPSSCTKLYLFYDASQIGKFDGSVLQGELITRRITEYPENTEQWNYSRRFGGDLIVALRSILPNIEDYAKHNTTFNINEIQGFDEDKFLELLSSFEPDVVITFYQRECATLSKWASSGGYNIPIVTAHKFQSYEANKVLVVQWRANSSNLGLCRDKHYVISAITRAKTDCLLIACNCPYRVKNLAQAISSSGGSPNSLAHGLETNFDTTVDTLNSLLNPINLQFVKSDGEVLIYKSNIRAGKYYSDNGVWKAHSHLKFVEDQMNAALNEPAGGAITSRVKNAKFLVLDASRVKALAWTIDQLVNTDYLHLGAELKGLKIRKSSGCPMMCGIKVKDGMKEILCVDDFWSNPSRNIAFDYTHPKAVQIAKWLSGELSNTFLDDIQLDARIEWFMVIDRAMNIPWTLIQLSRTGKFTCNTIKNDNLLWSTTLLKRKHMIGDNNWASVVKHTMLIKENILSNSLTGRRYTVLTDDLNWNISTSSNSHRWAKLFNLSLSTVRPIMRSNNLIGAFVTGMYMTPEQHIEKKTVVGEFLKRKLFSEQLLTLERQQHFVLTSSVNAESMAQLLQADKGLVSMIQHNAVCSVSVEHELIDSYLLAKFGTNDKTVSIKYSGLCNHLCAPANKHYINHVKPKQTELLSCWLSTITITQQWFKQFVVSMQIKLRDEIEILTKRIDVLSDEQLQDATTRLNDLNYLATLTLPIVQQSYRTDITLIGASSMHLTTDELEMLFNSSDRVFVVVDMEQYMPSTNRSSLLTVSLKSNNNLRNSVNLGYMIINDYCYTLNEIDRLSNYCVVQVLKYTPTYVNCKLEAANHTSIIAQIPVFNSNFGKVGEPLITVKQKSISKQLTIRLLNYCIANKPSNDELLAYVRSMLSTYDTTRTGIFPTYHTTIEDAVDAAMIASCVYKFKLSNLLVTADLIIDYIDIYEMFTTIVNTIDPLGAIRDTVNSMVSRSIGLIGIDVKYFIDISNALMLKLKPSLPKLRHLQPQYCQMTNESSGIIELEIDNTIEYINVMEQLLNVEINDSNLLEDVKDEVTLFEFNVTDIDNYLNFITNSTNLNHDGFDPIGINFPNELKDDYLEYGMDNFGFPNNLSRRDGAFTNAIVLELVDRKSNIHPSELNHVFGAFVNPPIDVILSTTSTILLPNKTHNVTVSFEILESLYNSINHHYVVFIEDATPVFINYITHTIGTLDGDNVDSIFLLAWLNRHSHAEINLMVRNSANVVGFTNEGVVLHNSTVVTFKRYAIPQFKGIYELSELLTLIDNIPIDDSNPYRLWTFWQNSDDSTENEFVDSCIQRMKEVTNLTLVEVNDLNVSTYLPNWILAFKEHISIQCWADVIRMYLLCAYGGIWVDASIVMTRDVAEYVNYIKNYDGFMWYSCLKGSTILELENWMICSKPNTPFLRLWLKLFFIIVNNKNNLLSTRFIIEQQMNVDMPEVNWKETYLTMHQASIMTQYKVKLDSYVCLPGFAGPLGWLYGDNRMDEWMTAAFTNSYKPQGGMFKFFNLARNVAKKVLSQIGRNVLDVFPISEPNVDYLIVGLGTRGDAELAISARDDLLTKNLKVLCVIEEAYSDDNPNNLTVSISNDYLALSANNDLIHFHEKFELINNIYSVVCKIAENTHAKFMLANMNLPCMMQLSRLTGSIPINFTGMPVFELADSSPSDQFFTFYKSNENVYNSVVNNCTRGYADKNNLPWTSNTVINGVASLIKILPVNGALFNNSLMSMTNHIVGNLVNSNKYKHVEESSILEKCTSEKIDMICLGSATTPTLLMSALLNLSSLSRSNFCLIVSDCYNSWNVNTKRPIHRMLIQLYTSHRILPHFDIMVLVTRVRNLLCHGGAGTISDAIHVGGNILVVGDFVDQPYWKTKLSNLNSELVRNEEVFGDVALRMIGHQTIKYAMSNQFSMANQLSDFSASRVLSKTTIDDPTIYYTPTGASNCVRLCVEHVHNMHSLLMSEITKGLFTELMDKTSMIEVLLTCEFNFAIYQNNEGVVWAWKRSQLTINFVLIDDVELLHCCLGHVKILTKMAITNSPSLMVNNKLSVFDGILTTSNSSRCRFNDFCSTGGFEQLMMALPDNKLYFAVNTTNLMARIMRVIKPVTLVYLSCQDGYVYDILQGSPTPSKLYLIIDKLDICFGIVVQVGLSIKLIAQSNKLQDLAILYDMGVTMQKNIGLNRSLIVDDYKPLNAVTLRWLTTNAVSFKHVRQIAVQNDSRICVYSYDNRSHDMYDESAILDGAKSIIWLTCNDVPEHILLLLDQTYNATDVRLVFSNGRFLWNVGKGTPYDKWFLKCMAKARHLEITIGVDWLIPYIIDELDKTLLMDTIKASKIEQSGYHCMSKNAWMTLLTLTDTDFDIISSICLNVLNDEFSGHISHDCDMVTATLLASYNDKPWAKISRTIVAFKTAKCFVHKPRKGGDEVYLEHEAVSLGATKDWWKPSNESLLPIAKQNIKTENRIDVLHNPEVKDSSCNLMQYSFSHMIDEERTMDEELTFNVAFELPDGTTFKVSTPNYVEDMWVNTDLSMDLRQYAPINPGTIRSKEHPDKIVKITKFKLNEEYPMESRPVLTKWVFEEHRSITGRLFSKIKYRIPKKIRTIQDQVMDIIKCYFINNFMPHLGSTNIIDIDAEATRAWIQKRKDSEIIQAEVDKMFTDELGLYPLNAINVHMKLESLMKENPWEVWGEHQARAIYWQRKAIAAISSPIFLKVKNRFKESLNIKFLYTDGMTPIEINKRLRNTADVEWFFEDDLVKQDRQTDAPLLDVEMELYRIFGVSSSVLSWWTTMHQNWKFKGRWNRGYATEMRLTGQSTTSLGNVFTNMQVHCPFFLRNMSILKLAILLGDDILAMFKTRPNVKGLTKEIRSMFNMDSKSKLSADSGVFCTMIAYKNDVGMCEIGPDYVRLKYRFEVTNGVSECTPEILESRVQSYCCMLGATPEVLQLNKDRGWSLPLLAWYDPSKLCHYTGSHYNLDEYSVENCYKILISYLRNPTPIQVDFAVYSPVKVY